MTKQLISRVIMLPDGSAHIALQDKNTIQCTSASLSEILSNPHAFIEEGQYKYSASTKLINSKGYSLNHIQGLTLLKIYSDAEIVCVFPKLFQALFASLNNDPVQPLDLKDIATDMALSDEKHFLMKFFFEFTNEPRSQLSVQRKLGVSIDVQNEIMMETFNTIFSSVAPEEITEPQPTTENDNISLFSSSETADCFVSLSEYARMHTVSPSTVYTWYQNGKLRGAIMVDNKIRVNKNCPRPEDSRKGRSMPKRCEQGLQKYLTNGNSYEALQKYIFENEILSPKIAPFINSIEELRYYIKHNYREVFWNGRGALIIDIKPDYVCKSLNMSNRELIKAGKTPRVPGNEDVEYNVHHIGERSDSPFAIIPTSDHISHYKIFHPVKSEGIDRSNFAIQKIAFWQKYLIEYDKTGVFRDIPSTSLRRKRDGKRL